MLKLHPAVAGVEILHSTFCSSQQVFELMPTAVLPGARLRAPLEQILS
jgi:hypothetical protein